MWTGWVGNDGKGGGPVLDNAEAGYDWSTYPERLQQAGISWKIYQDAGAGLDAAHFWGWGDDAYIGNYGDNSLLYFHQYQNAQPGSPLFEGALTRHEHLAGRHAVRHASAADVRANKLPQVSWIVAPEAYTEHPNWPANYGAWYVSQVLDALTANPEVWSKTALFLMYDENDGFFDHMVPPTPPQSRAQGLSTVDTTNEIFAGNADFAAGPYRPRRARADDRHLARGARAAGSTPRSSTTPRSSASSSSASAAQHPDLIEPNITPWRRAVAGDLTSAFNFKTPERRASCSLPSTAGYVPPDNDRHPTTTCRCRPPSQALPKQEPGVRPGARRALRAARRRRRRRSPTAR